MPPFLTLIKIWSLQTEQTANLILGKKKKLWHPILQTQRLCVQRNVCTAFSAQSHSCGSGLCKSNRSMRIDVPNQTQLCVLKPILSFVPFLSEDIYSCSPAALNEQPMSAAITNPQKGFTTEKVIN